MRKTAATEEGDDFVHDDIALRAVPDLAQMPVEDASGIHVGELFGALAEADSGLVRYVDLALDTLDRHVLVPIGHVRVRQKENSEPRVRLRAALLEELEQVPPFPADVNHISDPFERALLEAYGRTFHGERYYAHPAYDHSGLYVGEHPVVGPDEHASEDLVRLTELADWRVAGDETDVRGWPLRLGHDQWDILDLIIDTRAATARYAMVSSPAVDGARLVPVGYLGIDAEQRLVAAAGLQAGDLLALPRYDGGTVTREHENALHSTLRTRLSGRRRYALADYRADRDLPRV